MTKTNSKHNIVVDELEKVKTIEGEVAASDDDVLQKRLEQGKLLASLKNNTQGIEPWEQWVPANLGFSRKNADNYINLSKWYVAHFDDGRADKQAHLAAIKGTGAKAEYRHDGITSFNAVYEILSKRARKVKTALKPHKAGETTKVPKPKKLTQKQTFLVLRNDNTKLFRAVQIIDPKHPVLSEINLSILPEGRPTSEQTLSGGSSAKKVGKSKKTATADQIADDRLAAD
jgi:hypothetical protein